MSIYRMTLRFNLDDEAEYKAAEFLKQLDRKEYKSKNHFVIDLITAYIDRENPFGVSGRGSGYFYRCSD